MSVQLVPPIHYKCCDKLVKMLIKYYIVILSTVLSANGNHIKSRKRRYLMFTDDSQWGVYATISVPINSMSYVSVAWFYEASFYIPDNTTYFDPLLGDVYTTSRERKDRSLAETPKDIITRRNLYNVIESNLERHGFSGRACLLRAICENVYDHFLHNGLLGDLTYLILTPSTSISEEDLDDAYYRAEFYGLENSCECYMEDCPSSPLQQFSVHTNQLKYIKT